MWQSPGAVGVQEVEIVDGDVRFGISGGNRPGRPLEGGAVAPAHGQKVGDMGSRGHAYAPCGGPCRAPFAGRIWLWPLPMKYMLELFIEFSDRN
jgi:hypothetical protein